jgi:hypothetical protein
MEGDDGRQPQADHLEEFDPDTRLDPDIAHSGDNSDRQEVRPIDPDEMFSKHIFKIFESISESILRGIKGSDYLRNLFESIDQSNF